MLSAVKQKSLTVFWTRPEKCQAITTVPNYRAMYSKATAAVGWPCTWHNELACCGRSQVDYQLSISRNYLKLVCSAVGILPLFLPRPHLGIAIPGSRIWANFANPKISGLSRHNPGIFGIEKYPKSVHYYVTKWHFKSATAIAENCMTLSSLILVDLLTCS